MATAIADGLDWNLVRTFNAVVRSGSLAAAARELGFAHPTVARHIQMLEESLGLVLFDRTSHGLTLNEAGQRLTDAAIEMRRSALAFESASEAVRVAPPSVVRITVADMLCDLVPNLLAPGLDGKPGQSLLADNISVELNVTNQNLNLLQRDADIAIRLARPNQQELVARRVGELPMAAFATPNYLEEVGPLTDHTVSQHRFIDGISQHNFQSAAHSIGWPFSDDQIAFKSDSLVGQRAAMLAGLGIAGLPRYCVEGTNAVAIDDKPESRVALEVWIIARPELRNNVRYKAVFDALGSQLHEQLGQFSDAAS